MKNASSRRPRCLFHPRSVRGTFIYWASSVKAGIGLSKMGHQQGKNKFDRGTIVLCGKRNKISTVTKLDSIETTEPIIESVTNTKTKTKRNSMVQLNR
jgi:hypothetical protein